MSLFEGSGAAVVTPFGADGTVNYAALDTLIEHIVQGGTSAIFVCGTTGEPSTMTENERESVIVHTVKKVNKRIPVFAGSGGNNTATVVAFSQKCQSLGVDGLLAVTPYYNKCTQRGVIEYYRAISDAVRIPVIAYNVPTRTGFNIAPETAAQLAELKNVHALKEAGGDIDQIVDVARLLRGKMDWYSGDDSLTVPAMSLGAKGVISVAANVIPRKVTEMARLCLQNKYPEAAEVQFSIAPLVKALFCEVNPIPCKKALQLIGIDVGLPRAPLTELEPEHTTLLKERLQALGLIA